MNTKRKQSSFFYYSLIHFFIVSISCNAQADSARHTGFMSVRATITYTIQSPDKQLLDSLSWQEQQPLVKDYAGEKIKRILFQRSTGRAVVYFRGGDNRVIDKATAVRDGLFVPDPVVKKIEKAIYLPARPIEIFLDSPLYIGINNKVTIPGPGIDDVIIPPPGTSINHIDAAGKYSITVTMPGTLLFIFVDSATRKQKYTCQAMVKRLPEDDLATEPEVRLGNIKTLTAETALLKEQQQLFVGNGFTIAGGTAYFTGVGFRDVIVADVDQSLNYLKPYIELCMPGSVIVFDNLTVKDPAGKIYSVRGFSIKVIDEAFRNDPSVDYYSRSSFPEFTGGGDEGLSFYVKEQLTAGNDIGAAAGDKRVAFAFRVEADGTVSSLGNTALYAFNKLERRCFDIIKNGPAWKPGTFKEQNTAMVVTFFSVF